MTRRMSIWLAAAPVLFLLLWSGGYVVAKIGLQYAPPMTLLALRFGAVVALMAVLFIVIRPPLPKSRAGWAHLAFVGFLMQTIYFGLSYMAFTNGIAAGTAALIMSLQPILVAIVAPRWSGEHIGWRQWIALLIALGGTAIVIVARLEIGPPPVLGFVLAIMALCGITLATLWEKRFGLSHHPVTANLVGYAAGFLGLLPFLLLQDPAPVQWTLPFAFALFYLVVGNSLIAVGLLLAMVRAGQVSRVSTLLFLVPPATALQAWVFLDEPMPPLAWIGLGVAGLGVYLATRKRRL